MSTPLPAWKRTGWALARVLGVPVAFGMRWLLRLSSRKGGIVLMYHGVDDPPGDPDELVPAMASSVFEGK